MQNVQIAVGEEYAIGPKEYGGWVPSTAMRVRVEGITDKNAHFKDYHCVRVGGKQDGKPLVLADYQFMMLWDEYVVRRAHLRALRKQQRAQIRAEQEILEGLLAQAGIDVGHVAYTQQQQYGRQTCVVLPLELLAGVVGPLLATAEEGTS